jgi:hypothetical protein
MANSSILNQLQNSGWGGEWDAAGIDRYSELANLFQSNGIDSLDGGIDLVSAGGYYQLPSGLSANQDDVGEQWISDPNWMGKGSYVTIGGKQVGYLGDFNNDGTFGTNRQNDLKDNGLIGWSARGHGNTSYNLVRGPNGYEIQPNWGSSSDMGTVRDGLRGAAVIGGAALGMNAAFGGLGGAASAAPSLAGRVTTPALLESAAGTAGYGASSAGAGGFTGFGGALNAAGKGAATNAGITKLSGGSWNDALKAGAIGGLSAGLGSYVGDNYGQFLGGATRGAVSSGLQGGSLSDIAKSGLVSGLGSQMPNVHLFSNVW